MQLYWCDLKAPTHQCERVESVYNLGKSSVRTELELHKHHGKFRAASKAIDHSSFPLASYPAWMH